MIADQDKRPRLFGPIKYLVPGVKKNGSFCRLSTSKQIDLPDWEHRKEARADRWQVNDRGLLSEEAALKSLITSIKQGQKVRPGLRLKSRNCICPYSHPAMYN